MLDNRCGRTKLYFAAPLFNESEKRWNLTLRDLLAERYDVYLPQEDGLLVADLVRAGVSAPEASRLVFEADVAAITRSDVLLIVLDGRTVDEGAAFELGLARGLGKICYGLQTDVRRLAPWGNNPMIENALQQTFSSVDQLRQWIRHAPAKGAARCAA